MAMGPTGERLGMLLNPYVRSICPTEKQLFMPR